MLMVKQKDTLKRTYQTPDSSAVQVKPEGCIASSLFFVLGDMDNNELGNEEL